jgi:hypothetical protein
MTKAKLKAIKMAKKQIKKTIPDNEIELASVYFTISNMALLHLVNNPRNLLNEYHNINSIVWGETGYGMEPELKSWEKEVKKAKEGDYVYEEWQKQREKHIAIN